ncbi:RNA polymerase sigma factor [Mangrovibacterium diazotrophicum]|uniref:RNA polymerase sigma-70 factor (ECF subfamily) n=1 Tax=Mangrovibacterium diazotrophicum TaxID=1261403 RepID=A0A419VXI7_9BACT|nr:RNA polymerase sigma factor [Mangrovibacterium diazotrophicum]RKD87937.1 RNA polymerase sigma-70 factor (ECF subfamily) [Mangrovibacterium diazotrophicum]
MMTKETRFKEIVAENEERIRRICRYYAPSEEDSKDMCQEVLVNIWKSLDNFRGDAAMSTWIYRIAVNTSLSHSGKAFKQMKFRVDADEQTLGKLLEDDGGEQVQLLEKQLELMESEINQLSVIDKALISLMLEDVPGKEIANIIGITEPNVRVKLHRIKEILRHAMKNSLINQDA